MNLKNLKKKFKKASFTPNEALGREMEQEVLCLEKSFKELRVVKDKLNDAWDQQKESFTFDKDAVDVARKEIEVADRIVSEYNTGKTSIDALRVIAEDVGPISHIKALLNVLPNSDDLLSKIKEKLEEVTPAGRERRFLRIKREYLEKLAEHRQRRQIILQRFPQLK